VGIDIDGRGFVPISVKKFIASAMRPRPKAIQIYNGFAVESDEPIWLQYAGRNSSDESIFRFPSRVSLRISNMLVIRRLQVTLREVRLSEAADLVTLVLDNFPDFKAEI